MSHAIELINLKKTYRPIGRPKVNALDDVSLQIHEGEAFGFVGPNGAGKSTTIKIIVDALKADAGQALIHGVDSREAASRHQVAYVPESPYLYDHLSPLEILEAGCKLHHVKKDQLQQHCMQWLERFDLARVARARLRGFSKGMAQRTALAHALAIEPRLLILDEPLSGLDPVGRKDVVDILVEYRRGGGTIFFSSHVLHDVERMADRFGLIHKGKIRTVQSPDELLAREQSFLVRTRGDLAVEGLAADTGNRWSGEASQSELWPLLNRAQLAGHVIQEVRPSMNLEKAFFEFIAQD
ncbi:ABC transporter ATP-binding protein [Burkholderiaceae bacterium DAT-1]|nr:ABC transporter ATP-binding protein [Burkholderiaceae bacterium DAT-1]